MKYGRSVQVLFIERICVIQGVLDIGYFILVVELVKGLFVEQINDSDIFVGFKLCKGMVDRQCKFIDVGGVVFMFGFFDFYFRQEIRIDIVIN